jgi:hypothetical protein
MPTETGLKIASNGQITFAAGQTFPGTGNGTITGVTAGTDLTGGGSSGSVTLKVDTTKVPELSAANNFTANQTVTGNITATGTVTGGTVNATSGFNLNGTLFASGNSSTGNAFVGFAGNPASTGSANTAVGKVALAAVSSGFGNTAIGNDALESNSTGSNNEASGGAALAFNTSGSNNTADGADAMFNNSTGSLNTAVGSSALANNQAGNSNTAVGFSAGAAGTNAFTSGSLDTFLGASSTPGVNVGITNATAVGAMAEVDASNSMVLGSINGVNGATASTNVGIGITKPTFLLHIGNGGGAANNNYFRVEGPTQSGTGGFSGSFGGFGDFNVDAVGIVGGRFTVKENGRVGIGFNAPDNTLTVNGSADKPGGGSWGTFSDARLKNLHGDFVAGLSEILKLQPVRYRYKDDNALGIQDSEEHVGFVAQDVQKVIPAAVSKNEKGYLLVNNDPILWAMLNAIKEQQRQIRQQQRQIRLQTKRIEAQYAEMARLRSRDAVLESRLKEIEHSGQSHNLSRVTAFFSPDVFH